MPTQNVNLSDQQVEFIRKAIDDGDFRNASEVIRAGLRLLTKEQEENRLKLKALRAMVKEGFDAIDSGDFEVLTKDNLSNFLESLGGSQRRRKTA